MSRLRIMRLSSLAGTLVLLMLAGCGGHTTAHGASTTAPATAHGTQSNSPGNNDASQPPTEGSGPESPLPTSSNGVALSVASLPVGDGGSNPTNDDQAGNPQADCVDVLWLGTLTSPASVTVTGVVVTAGPFVPVDPGTAGCTADDGPPCVGQRFTAADNGSSSTCAVGAKLVTGQRAPSGAVELTGQFSCSGLSVAACQQVLSALRAKARQKGPDTFDFPMAPPSVNPPGSTAPSTGSSPTTDTNPSPTAPSSP